MSPAILVVEDNQDDALFLQMALKRADISNPVQFVKDGRQAMDYLDGIGGFSDREKFPLPYLVLLDLKLPQVMGLEVLKWLRERKQFDLMIVIVLTSSRNPADIDAAYRLHTNAYLVKPSRMENLVLIVNSIRDFWLAKNQPPSIFTEGLKACAP